VVESAAYTACIRLARAHYENFPVASWMLPRESRPHIAAIYAFARTADDFADEGDRTPEARLALLNDWEARLVGAARGRVSDDTSDYGLIFRALAETMRTFDLGPEPFSALLSAFRQDVITRRYERWDDLLDYCRRSANPIGQLVLRVTRHEGRDLLRYSDAVCTALQLANFWQDLARDWLKGRLYVPRELTQAVGADEADLARGYVSREWQSALQEASRRTRMLFEAGRPLPSLVRGRLRWELRATWLGGLRILARTEAAHFDVFTRRPVLGWRDGLWIAARLAGR
jgi:squalene synthase HpnC